MGGTCSMNEKNDKLINFGQKALTGKD